MAARELIFDILAIDRASAIFDRVGRASTQAGRDSEGASGVMKSAWAGAAIGLGLVGAESIKMAGDFEASVTRLNTSAGESKANLAMVGQGMLDMAGQVGYTSLQLSQGMYVVESAGFHGAAGLSVLRAAAEGAKTENADLGTVANAVSTIMVDFGTRAGDAAQVTSTLISAVSVGKTNFEDLSGAMHAVMPRAAALHMAFPEIAADLATMTAHGMSAEQSAQNLNGALRQLSAPTLAMSKSMADFGIQSHDVSANLSKNGLQGTLEMLSTTIMSRMGPAGAELSTVFNQSKLAAQDAAAMYGGLSPKLQQMATDYQAGKISMHDWTVGLKDLDAPSASLLKQWAAQENASKGFSNTLKSGGDAAKTYTGALSKMVGGQEATTVALMLTGDQAAKATANIKTVSGATSEAGGHAAGFAEQQATLNGKISDAKGAFSALGIELGTQLMPAAKSSLDVLTTGVGWLATHEDFVKGFGETILALAQGYIVVKGAMMAYAAWQTIATAATALGESTFGTYVGVMALSGLSAIRGVIGAIREWTVVQAILDSALMANPIGLVIIAIAALAAGLIFAYQHCDTFRSICDTAFHAVASAASWMWNSVIKPVITFLLNGFGNVASGIGDMLSALSNIPGFGWAADAAAALQRMGTAAHNAAAELNAVPDTKHVVITFSANGLSTIPGVISAVAGAAGRNAGGTSNWRGGLTWVGERGPELLNVPSGSAIHTADQSRNMTSGNSGPLVQIEHYHEAGNSSDQVAADLMFRLRSA